MIAKALLFLLLLNLVSAGSALAQHSSVPEAVEQAHSELWHRMVDKYGIIRDYVGELPTPEDCKLGKPNAIGWWSPIENGPMFTGLYLPAACERARRSGNPKDKEEARKLAQGLIKCASVSDVPGFVARGIGSDGSCHYPMGSDDQTHPWFLGLHAYLKSGIPTNDERKEIIAKVKEVADVLASTEWKCPCDGAFKGQFRGGYGGHLFRDAVRLLHILRVVHDVTGDPVWLERYQKAVEARPVKDGKTRREICALGYDVDREAIQNIDNYQLWIYIGSQASLAQLAAMETNETLKAAYNQGLAANAKNAKASVDVFEKFDNKDMKVFGNANWRAVYSTWFPQATQEDARKLSEKVDAKKRGDRKHYEAQYMKNPLAAATMLALANQGREAIEHAICHYDYSKLNMAEFFMAETAFYALPQQGR